MKNIQLPSPILLMLVPVLLVIIMVCVKLNSVDINPSVVYVGKQIFPQWNVSLQLF